MATLSLEQGLDLLARRAQSALVALYVFGALSVGAALVAMAEGAGAIDLEAAELDPLSALGGFTSLLYLVVLVVSVVFVGMWIYRAHANLRAAGYEGLEFSPGWAVGWFFVPIANLFKPFQAMRELWSTSHGEVERYGDEPAQQLGLWWGTWIAGNVLSNISERFETSGLEGGSGAGSLLNVLGTLLLLAAAWFLVRIIRQITAAQQSSVRALATFA